MIRCKCGTYSDFGITCSKCRLEFDESPSSYYEEANPEDETGGEDSDALEKEIEKENSK